MSAHLSNESAKQLLKALDRIARKGHHISQVFRDFVSLSLYTLCRNDDLYLEIMGQYRNDDEYGQREADHFKEAFHLLLQATAEANHDVMGDLYMEIASSYSTKGMGQFFTPIPVSDMVADMTIPDQDEREGLRVLEPAAGSGRFLISAARRLHSSTEYVAVDADRVCAQMTALNCCLFNMNAFVLFGNTLSMKYWEGYRTQRSPIGGAACVLTEEQLKRLVQSLETALQEPEDSHNKKATNTEHEKENKSPEQKLIVAKNNQLALF